MPNQFEAWLICYSDHHTDPWDPDPAAPHNNTPLCSLQPEPARPAAQNPIPPTSDSTRNLRRRLDNANAYFRRKAAEVLTDDTAVGLLAVLYQDGLVELAKLNAGQLAIPLAKLTAAGFCEIGVNAICITESGQRFVWSLIPFVPATDAGSHRKTPTQTADNTL